MHNLINDSIAKTIMIRSVIAILVLTVILTSMASWQYFGPSGVAVSFLLTVCLALLVIVSILKTKSPLKTIIYSASLIFSVVIFSRADLWLEEANYGPQAYRESVMRRIESESRTMIIKRAAYSDIKVTTENGVKSFGVDIKGTVPNIAVAEQFQSEFIDRFPELDPYHIVWDVTLKNTNERLKGRNGVFSIVPKGSRNDRATSGEDVGTK
jgi:predicted neutral ceramidase superfamily lipid hydrolase